MAIATFSDTPDIPVPSKSTACSRKCCVSGCKLRKKKAAPAPYPGTRTTGVASPSPPEIVCMYWSRPLGPALLLIATSRTINWALS